MAKSIVEKLNLHKYQQVAVLDCPEATHYFSDLESYDPELTAPHYDLIFAFVFDMAGMQALVKTVIDKGILAPGGYLYIAYPKKGNKVYETFIHRDSLFEGLGADEQGYIGASRLKFARMVGLDDVFTVVGLKNDVGSKMKASTKASQSVDDYIDRIADVEKDLKDTPDLLAFYQSLTPGYRKDWARYIYSAKQEATRGKRREEMRMILKQGYKSRDLYNRRESE